MYEINSLFFYHALFMVELLAAEFLFFHRLEFRKGAGWRIPLMVVLCIGSSFTVPTLSNVLVSVASFVGMTIVTFFAAMLVLDTNWITIAFCCLAGFSVQHLSYEAYDLILLTTRLSETTGGFYETTKITLFGGPLQLVIYAAVYLLLYWLVYWIYGRRIRKRENISYRSWAIFILALVCVFSDALINSLVIEFAENAPYQVICCIDAASVMLCLLSLAVQFEISYRNKLNDDVAFLKIVRSKEREQYRLSKENAELVQIKVHDLKHQLRQFGESKSLSPEVIEEMNQVISIYDSFAQTGNPSLDLVLSEKALIAEKNSIPLSFIVDGKAVEFLSESDTFALFSNILDNAIEAVLPLSPDKRSITLSVRLKKNFVSIVESNRYDNPNMVFANGLPVTIKKDKINHGYGLKSIRYMVNKYDGDIEISANGQVFTLSILLPVPSAGAES